jgi:S1-C subfamily serine protease
MSVRADGPAAGQLYDGDVLLAVNGESITSPHGQRGYARIERGERVRLTVRRNGSVQTLTITAGEQCILLPPAPVAPPDPVVPPTSGMAELLPAGWFGFEIECRDCGKEERGGALRFRFRAPPIVVGIMPGSPADRAGIRVGDSLVDVDGIRLTSEAGWPRFAAIQPGQRVRMTYARAGQPREIMMSALRRP